MADKKTTNPLKSPAEKDIDAIRRFNVLQKASMENAARLNKHYEWRGNKMPPMSIEPFPFEAMRLRGGMSAADRALRKQWVHDQLLAPNEPRFVPDLYPRNPIRRLLGAPWEALFNVLKPVVGEHVAAAGRKFVPQAMLVAAFGWFCYYHVKYNPSKWEGNTGWNVYSTRPVITPDHPDWPNSPHKAKDDFYDRGFQSRSSHVGENLKTSSQ